MKNFMITLSLHRQNREILMPCQANDYTDAQNLAEALANLMPAEENVYFEKSGRHGTLGWTGTADEVINNS